MSDDSVRDAAASAPLGPGAGPLAGIVVADFSRVLAGPYCTMLLVGLGATVLKVEGPGGDDTRHWKPPAREGVSTYYLSVNRGKHSLVLDLKDRQDLEMAWALLDRSDVFVENWKPGGLEKFGLDAASVARRWPHLVHASITGFGTAGGASMPGCDLLVQAVSGMMDLTGSPDGPPQRTGVAVFDVITGLHAAVGILAALLRRKAEGTGGAAEPGGHVELDLLTSALAGLANQTSGFVAAGKVPRRLGNDHPSLFPYGPFRTADQELVVCCGNDAQFGRLVETLGVPDLAEDPRFATMEARNGHREELRGLLEEALVSGTAEEWFETLQERGGVPCAPILTVAGGVDFARDLCLEPVVEVGPEAVPMMRNPISLDGAPVLRDKTPPRPDEDREAILAWLARTPPRGSASGSGGVDGGEPSCQL